MPIPTQLSSNLQHLAIALDLVTTMSLDFETTSLDPTFGQIVGAGLYLPDTQQAFYINIGHMLLAANYPRYTSQQFADTVRPFLLNPTKRLIAHNATFELRFLQQLGLSIRCIVSCSMIHSHRVDENLRSKGRDVTTHYHSKVSYGLKELTAIYFNEQPQTLEEVTGGKAVVATDVHAVAQYCVLDCYNANRLRDRAATFMETDPFLGQLTYQVDDPNMPPLARMMQAGVLIDEKAITAQIPKYIVAIQACREKIWEVTKTQSSLDTPTNILHLLRHLNLDDDLGHDPFWMPIYPNESEPSHSKDILLSVFAECPDPDKRLVLALIIAKNTMEQRLSAFLRPWVQRSSAGDNRLRPSNFTSTLVTTRFSSSPNLQNLPGRADATEDEEWREILPEPCRESHSTRSIFIAKPGHSLVSMDLSAAEPRYLALLFQRALIHREAPFNQKRDDLQALRWGTYPVLMQRMKATQLPIKEWKPPQQIRWPAYTQDPLYHVFKVGEPFNDPYDALLAAMDPQNYQQAVAAGTTKKWLKSNRSKGKKAFLALGYGSSADALAPQLKWTVQQTEEAIANLENTYATLKPLRELTLREMLYLGEVRSLWGRPRRINGYYQLARPNPVTVCFYRLRSNTGTYSPRTYIARIIPLGTTQQGVQAFVEECYIEMQDGHAGEVVLRGDPATGALIHKSLSDEFVNAPHFNTLPFRNINFSQLNWVRDEHGLKRYLPKQNRALRQSFNSLCQSTGADHLRWLMNRMEAECLSLPEFADCQLILTVHDSLVFEVPDEKLDAFVPAGRAIMMARPAWCDIDMKVGIEVGKDFGNMSEFSQNDTVEKLGCIGRLLAIPRCLFRWIKNLFK